MWRGDCLLCLLFTLAFASGAASRRPLVRAPRDANRTGDHLVVADSSLSSDEFRQLLARVSKVSDDAAIHSYVESVAKVITASLSPYSLEMVRQFPGVDHLEEEDEANGDGLTSVPWHLDRLDQTQLPLDSAYQPVGSGKGVDVYVLDSGIAYEHSEFEFRAKYAGYDPYDAYAQKKGLSSVPMRGRDCHGHGTHVASLCGGKTFGTAKKVTVYSVRVLSCMNSAPWSVVLDGLEFMSQVIGTRMRPAIVTMSLSGSFHASVNEAVADLYRKNIPVITVAGNGETDCCRRSPASSRHAITVAGTRLGDGLYQIGQGTNFGRCVDIFAPGEQILGANYLCPNCTKRLSGTSMAAPMVAGLVAVHLGRKPRMTTAQVVDQLVADALEGVIDFQGMPRHYRTLTPNRLAHITGSCGSSTFPLSQSSFHTPMFPNHYLNNLNCEWNIRAATGQQIKVTFHTIRTEWNFDIIQVIDGDCWDHKNTLATLSGDLGAVNMHFTSLSPSLCVKFSSDGLTEFTGFNATYTKVYENTNITVPIPLTRHTYPSSTILRHRQDFGEAEAILGRYRGDGYHANWCTTYHSNGDSYVDLILTNRSDVDTVCVVEIGNRSLPRLLTRMERRDHYPWYINTHARGRSIVRPMFSVLFSHLPSHLEHVFYHSETEDEYLNYLETNRQRNFTLLSHSFYLLDDQLFASSVYIRDRRLALGVPVESSSLPRWNSFYNLSFVEFSTILTSSANHSFFPSSISTHRGRNHNDSRFAVVLQEELVERGAWFAWGLNKSEADTLIETSQASFKPVLSLGYSYGNREEFYLQFIRKENDDL